MKRLILVGVVVVALLTAGVVPQAVYAVDGKKKTWLTPEEERYISRVYSLTSSIRGEVAKVRAHLAKPRIGDKEWHRAGMYLMEIGMGYDARRLAEMSAPESFQAVHEAYAPPVFGKANTLYFSYAGGVPSSPEYFMEQLSWLEGTRGTLDEIEASLIVLEVMVGDRAVEIEENREKGEEIFEEGCFIATAAYGTPAAEEIDILRQWRDKFLLHSPAGKAFVAVYYEVSPPIAEFISEQELVRTVVREGFVDPVVSVVELTQSWWTE